MKLALNAPQNRPDLILQEVHGNKVSNSNAVTHKIDLTMSTLLGITQGETTVAIQLLADLDQSFSMELGAKLRYLI